MIQSNLDVTTSLLPKRQNELEVAFFLYILKLD